MFPLGPREAGHETRGHRIADCYHDKWHRRVAFLTASEAGVPAVTITSTPAASNSAMSAANRSCFLPPSGTRWRYCDLPDSRARAMRRETGQPD